MVDRHQCPLLKRNLLTSYIFESVFIFHETRISKFPECDNDLWIDKLDLFKEVRLAAGKLRVQYLVMMRRTALERVCKIDVMDIQTQDVFYHLLQRITRSSAEAVSALIFYHRWRTVNKHDIGIGIAKSVQDPLARLAKIT